MILGLDCSTAVCGWCLLKDNGTFVSIGYHKFLGKDLYEKLAEFNKMLEDIICELNDTSSLRFAIEAPLIFAKRSNAHTMSILQRFNGMVCASIFNRMGKIPISIDARDARNKLGIRFPYRAKNVKEIVFAWVRKKKVIKEDTWEFKKTGNPKETCFDMTDAYVIAACALKLMQ